MYAIDWEATGFLIILAVFIPFAWAVVKGKFNKARKIEPKKE